MDEDRAAAVTAAHGTQLVYEPAPDGVRRRVREVDRRGTPLATLRWGPGILAAAWVRIPDGRWLAVHPRAGEQSPWGRVDRIALAADVGDDGSPLTVFEALDWSRIDRIPTLAEPARLPAGGGVAVLNLIAALALDQRAGSLAYRGPYPSEQLFLALLESFRYEGRPADPLAAFTTRRLTWVPAPHERVFEPDGVYVQLRERVDKVVWDGRTYHRPDWQGVMRHAPRRVWDAADGVRCSLWALGEPLEDHLRLTPTGELRSVVDRGPPLGEVRPLGEVAAAGIGAIVAAQSTAALAPLIRAHVRTLQLEWGPLEHALVDVGPMRARVSMLLRARLAAALPAAGAPAGRAALALAALAEIALEMGDTLRAQAQSRLAALDEEEQRARLAAVPDVAAGAADAAVIANAVGALLADVAE